MDLILEDIRKKEVEDNRKILDRAFGFAHIFRRSSARHLEARA